MPTEVLLSPADAASYLNSTLNQHPTPLPLKTGHNHPFLPFLPIPFDIRDGQFTYTEQDSADIGWRLSRMIADDFGSQLDAMFDRVFEQLFKAPTGDQA
jgi:hypothetical protein